MWMSIAHSDHNYILPATLNVEKSVLNCIAIRPRDLEGDPTFCTSYKKRAIII